MKIPEIPQNGFLEFDDNGMPVGAKYENTRDFKKPKGGQRLYIPEQRQSLIFSDQHHPEELRLLQGKTSRALYVPYKVGQTTKHHG